MDKPREGIAEKKLIRPIIMGVAALAAIGIPDRLAGANRHAQRHRQRQRDVH